MDSDTESESQASTHEWEAAEFAPISTVHRRGSSESTSQTESISISGRGVEAAIADLHALDMKAVQENDSLHGVIQRASATILTFLNGIVAAPFPDAPLEDIERAIAALLDPAFITLLFAYRQVFYAIAAREARISSAVVCWVDVVLAKLGDAVSAVAAGPVSTFRDRQEHQLAGMQKQMEGHALRASTQLPGTLDALPNMLGTNHTSPAALRLSLRLLYGIYILRPHIQGTSPSQSAGFSVEKLSLPLSLYLDRHSSVAQRSVLASAYSEESTVQDRVSYAMFLSLFSATDVNQLSRDPRSFRPNTEATLLRLIVIVMCPENPPSTDTELISPCVTPDTAQLILMRHPETMSWCWTVWDDQRIAHAEVIDYLTATWFYHLGDPLEDSRRACEADQNRYWDEDALEAMDLGPAVACSTITRLIYRSLSQSPRGSLQPASLDVMHKACCCATYLLGDRGVGSSLLLHEISVALCIFFFLFFQDSAVTMTKDVILESLSLVPTDVTRPVVDDLFSRGTDIHTSLEHIITLLNRWITDEARRSKSGTADISSLRQLLQFMTLVWHSGARLDLSGQILACFLRDLIDWVSSGRLRREVLKALDAPLVLALAAHNASKNDRPWKHNAVWEFALQNEPTNLAMASAFSAYICATARHCDVDPLTYAEGWNYLRDTLLLILTNHFLGPDEPQALLVCSLVCEALRFLAVCAGDSAAQYILSSPWTINLCTELENINKISNVDTGIYHQHLRTRLGPYAASFVSAMRRALSVHGQEEIDLVAPTNWLLFCRFQTVPQILVIPTSS